MITLCFHLRFTTPLRAGRRVGASGLEAASPFLHADTLFSALCNTWALYEVVPDEELASLGDREHAPPFLLSSAFPYVEQGIRTDYYVPTPVTPAAALEGNLPRGRRNLARKAFRAAPFVPLDVMRTWRNPGMPLDDGTLGALDDWQRGIRELRVGKHAQDRLSDAAALYHVAGFRFGTAYQEAGLWGLVRFPQADSEWLERVREGLALLGSDGVGGRRTEWGRFEAALEDAPYGSTLCDWLNEAPAQRPGLLLSPCLPTQADAAGIANVRHDPFSRPKRYPQRAGAHVAPAPPPDLAYRLVRREGWTYSERSPVQTRRKGLAALAEGSVFPAGLELSGQVIDVRTANSPLPHPSWRYGRAFLLPL